MSIKTTSSHEGNLRTERGGNSDTQFLLYALLRLLVHTCTKVMKKRAPRDIFSEIMENTVYLK